MEPYLSKALWRAGMKLGVGLAVLGAIVGIRFVTAKPAGLESDLAELERFDAAQAAAASADPGAANDEAQADSSEAPRAASATDDASRAGTAADAASATSSDADADGLDRMVRCRLGGERPFMRAADCATRGGELEELPPPPPPDAPAQP